MQHCCFWRFLLQHFAYSVWHLQFYKCVCVMCLCTVGNPVSLGSWFINTTMITSPNTTKCASGWKWAGKKTVWETRGHNPLAIFKLMLSKEIRRRRERTNIVTLWNGKYLGMFNFTIFNNHYLRQIVEFALLWCSLYAVECIKQIEQNEVLSVFLKLKAI